MSEVQSSSYRVAEFKSAARLQAGVARCSPMLNARLWLARVHDVAVRGVCFQDGTSTLDRAKIVGCLCVERSEVWVRSLQLGGVRCTSSIGLEAQLGLAPPSFGQVLWPVSADAGAAGVDKGDPTLKALDQRPRCLFAQAALP